MIRHPSHNQPKQRSHSPCNLQCLLFFFSCTRESPAACLSSLVLLRRVQTLLHSQAHSVGRRKSENVHSGQRTPTKTGRFRHLSPIFPSAHLSAQKMSQTSCGSDRWSSCFSVRVSFTVSRTPSRTEPRRPSRWGGEELNAGEGRAYDSFEFTLPLAHTSTRPTRGKQAPSLQWGISSNASAWKSPR